MYILIVVYIVNNNTRKNGLLCPLKCFKTHRWSIYNVFVLKKWFLVLLNLYVLFKFIETNVLKLFVNVIDLNLVTFSLRTSDLYYLKIPLYARTYKYTYHHASCL